MGVSKKLRAGLAVSVVLASCQLAGCGSDTVDQASGGASNSAGKAGSGQAGKAGGANHAGAGDAEAGMAGESGGDDTAGNSSGGNGGNGGSGGLAGSSGAGAGGLASAGKGGGGAAGASAGSGGSGIPTAGASGGGAGGQSGGGAGGASGGAAGATTCGNGTLDTGEVCDTKFTVNNCGSDCKAITASTCLACESAAGACDPAVLTCDNATGNASAGPASGVAKSALCNETLDCVRDSGCAADGQVLLKSCYCGTASVSNCTAGQGNGPCKAVLDRSLETTSFTEISNRIGNAAYGGGLAMKRVDCDQGFCSDDYGCFPQ